MSGFSHPADKYTVQWKSEDGRWHDWRFIKQADVASWKTEAGAERYAERLRKDNPGREFRVTFWPGVFSIPADRSRQWN